MDVIKMYTVISLIRESYKKDIYYVSMYQTNIKHNF